MKPIFGRKARTEIGKAVLNGSSLLFPVFAADFLFKYGTGPKLMLAALMSLMLVLGGWLISEKDKDDEDADKDS